MTPALPTPTWCGCVFLAMSESKNQNCHADFLLARPVEFAERPQSPMFGAAACDGLIPHHDLIHNCCVNSRKSCAPLRQFSAVRADYMPRRYLTQVANCWCSEKILAGTTPSIKSLDGRSWKIEYR